MKKLPVPHVVIPLLTFIFLFLTTYFQVFTLASFVTPIPSKNSHTLASETTSSATPVPTATPSSVPKIVVKKGPPPPAPVRNTATFPGTGRANNKFGMYMLPAGEQIPEIAQLINSNGGDWGYVLVPMFITERDPAKWNSFFQILSNNHLIPVIQISAYNFAPNTYDWPGLATFLGSLSWPSKQHYLTIFNETNDEKYWSHRIAPDEYAVALNEAITALKTASADFFIMNGGFNSSARSGAQYLSQDVYMQRMNSTVPGIFKRLDGWGTHAYPQPEFSGDFYNPPSWYSTRDEIENYKWEMSLLSAYGVSGLPIFITETGWAHKEGNQPKKEYRPASLTATYFDDAYRNHWLPNPQIVAIFPFIWKMDIASNFEWVKPGGGYYPQYDVVKNIPKIHGSAN